VYELIVTLVAAASKLIDSMYRIRKLSQQMLAEKLQDSNILLNDSDAKKDIMSILVRARKAELDGGKGGYAMSDRAMMDQVVSRCMIGVISCIAISNMAI